MTHLRKAAEAALQALEHSTTHGSLTGAEWVFEEVEAAITALREALAAPVVPASFTDDDMKASWLTGFKEAEFQFRGCTEKSGEFPAKTPLSVAPRAAPPITTHPAPVVPEELTISTEHGPWKQSQYDEHETYCARCQVRDIFRTHRKCEPHIVAAAPKPKEQT